jgi:predicted ATP-grasp superfamily ATP-dependent carboligase
LREHPDGYLAFVEKLLAARQFDVLLPSHEQGFLFARVAERLQARVGLALPSFENYRTAHSKAGFSWLLGDMGLPQLATSIVTSEQQLRGAMRLPTVIKTSVGTASRGVWFVRNADDLENALTELAAGDAFAGEVLVQEFIAGCDREGAVGVLPWPIDWISRLSTRGRRRRRVRSVHSDRVGCAIEPRKPELRRGRDGKQRRRQHVRSRYARD